MLSNTQHKGFLLFELHMETRLQDFLVGVRNGQYWTKMHLGKRS
uniref:Uncharacterized protein n=1 Tax=Arundo donax TaxID=35708 RepID=A0A0A9GUJ5_ARUDO